MYKPFYFRLLSQQGPVERTNGAQEWTDTDLILGSCEFLPFLWCLLFILCVSLLNLIWLESIVGPHAGAMFVYLTLRDSQRNYVKLQYV